jgi:DNA-binding FrmR family transcriptional regulator
MISTATAAVKASFVECPRALGLLDEPDDLGEGGLAADPCGFDHEVAVAVHGCADDLVARTDLDRHRLAGDHRHVDGGVPVDDGAVGRDLGPGPDHEPHTDLELVEGDFAAVFEGCGLDAELGEFAQGVTGASASAGFEPAAEQDQRDDDRGRLEVDVRRVGVHPRVGRAPEEQGEGRPAPGRERAHRDEGVHRRGAVTEVHEGGSMERSTGVEHDRCRKGEGPPLPAVEHQGRDHRDGEQWHREHGGERQASAERTELSRLEVGVVDFGNRVAEGLDLGPEVVHVDLVGIEDDRGTVGRQVDVGLFDARQTAQSAADARRAAGAGHALDRQVDSGRHGLHTIPPLPMINPVAGYSMNKDDYLKRLRRIEGQVRGLQAMVDDDTYCIDVLTQISSVTKALQAVGLGLLDEHVRHCVRDAVAESEAAGDEKVDEAIAAIDRLLRA